jgi:hypothetical protein
MIAAAFRVAEYSPIFSAKILKNMVGGNGLEPLTLSV